MATATLDFSKPHVLRDEREYDAAVAELDALLDREHRNGEEEDRLEFLTLLVEAYDEAHYPMGETSTPQSVVEFLLEQNAMTRTDLAPLFGGRSRVSDFFSGNRRLSLGQIQALRDRFGISADVLLPPELPTRQVKPSAKLARPRTRDTRESRLSDKRGPSGRGGDTVRHSKGGVLPPKADTRPNRKDIVNRPAHNTPKKRAQAAKPSRTGGHKRG